MSQRRPKRPPLRSSAHDTRGRRWPGRRRRGQHHLGRESARDRGTSWCDRRDVAVARVASGAGRPGTVRGPTLALVTRGTGGRCGGPAGIRHPPPGREEAAPSLVLPAPVDVAPPSAKLARHEFGCRADACRRPRRATARKAAATPWRVPVLRRKWLGSARRDRLRTAAHKPWHRSTTRHRPRPSPAPRGGGSSHATRRGDRIGRGGRGNCATGKAPGSPFAVVRHDPTRPGSLLVDEASVRGLACRTPGSAGPSGGRAGSPGGRRTLRRARAGIGRAPADVLPPRAGSRGRERA